MAREKATIVQQVPGPKSFSEYKHDGGLPVQPGDEEDWFGRRNACEISDDVPSVGVHGR